MNARVLTLTIAFDDAGIGMQASFDIGLRADLEPLRETIGALLPEIARTIAAPIVPVLRPGGTVGAITDYTDLIRRAVRNVEAEGYSEATVQQAARHATRQLIERIDADRALRQLAEEAAEGGQP